MPAKPPENASFRAMDLKYLDIGYLMDLIWVIDLLSFTH